MRVAAIYDIHANLSALEAALEEIRYAEVDRIVVGGDVLPGPFPRETIQCLLDLDIPAQSSSQWSHEIALNNSIPAGGWHQSAVD